MSIRAARKQLAGRLAFGEDVEMAHPASVGELSALLAEATAKHRRVLVWGGGTHQGMGYRVDPDLVLFTDRLDAWIDWEPDDLTVVVEAGVKVDELEKRLAARGQSAMLAEVAGTGTVGGAVAAGISGYRRARFGPIRDRLLEVVVVTGDGRVVRGGGRVVKNVTGYDIPRLAVGSFGSLGVIVSVCFKLWPLPPATATVTLEEPAPVDLYRPLAVLSDGHTSTVYLAGTEAEVDDLTSRLGGAVAAGLHWPQLPEHDWTWSLRVPPAAAEELLRRIPGEAEFIHQVGIGEIALSTPSADGMADLRVEAEAAGGALIVVDGPDDEFEPWGTPPPSLHLQRQVIAAFDPARVVNPGRLPGRL